MKQVPFATRLSADLHSQLREQAATEDRTLKAVLERALREYFENHKEPARAALAAAGIEE